MKSLKVFTPRNPIDKTWQTSPVIYRIHAKPPMEDQKKVKAALRNFAPASQKKECTFVDPDLCWQDPVHHNFFISSKRQAVWLQDHSSIAIPNIKDLIWVVNITTCMEIVSAAPTFDNSMHSILTEN